MPLGAGHPLNEFYSDKVRNINRIKNKLVFIIWHTPYSPGRPPLEVALAVGRGRGRGESGAIYLDNIKISFFDTYSIN